MAKKKKIKVAFPHMGTISIAWAAGLRKKLLFLNNRIVVVIFPGIESSNILNFS